MSSKQLSDKEISGVLACDAPTRYSHFVKGVADWGFVWGLHAEDGWFSMATDDGTPVFPVWPHEPYARLLADGDWKGAQPTSIEVHEWTEKWLPNLDREGNKVAVFPTPTGKGVVVDPLQLRDDILAELARIE